MATFAQLKQRAQNLALNDDDTEAGYCVNDALTDIVVSAQLKVTQVSKPLAAGQSVYDISSDWSISDFGALQYLEYLGLGSTYSYILEQSSPDELLALNATNPIGATRKYAFLGLDTIRLWPVPQQGVRLSVSGPGCVTISGGAILILANGVLSGDAVAVTNIASGPAGFYDITTSSNHGFSNGQNVYFVLYSSSNGQALDGQTFAVETTASPDVFRIAYSGAVVTGAANGAVGSPQTYYTDGIGSYAGTYTYVVYSTGSMLANAAAGNASYESCTLSSGNDTLKIYYARTSTDLVSDTDVPTDIPAQWHWLITIGAAARLADAVGEDQNLSNALDAKFVAGMDRFQKWLTRRIYIIILI